MQNQPQESGQPLDSSNLYLLLQISSKNWRLPAFVGCGFVGCGTAKDTFKREGRNKCLGGRE